MKTIHISYGGPDRRIRDATGKVWRFEMHPYCGPCRRDQTPGKSGRFGAALAGAGHSLQKAS